MYKNRKNMELDTVKLNIKYIKDSYPKKVRLELINNLLEMQSDKLSGSIEQVENIHNMLDQIFSVVLKNLKWNIASSTNDWDYRPIEVMKEVFPNIDKTRWYNMRHKQVMDQLNK